jgi:thiosulfate dehydrogenase (quinone)
MMSTLTVDGTAAASNEAAQRGKADIRRVAALALLSIRFIQGFFYWGGGSRRFIYAPAKLDPNAADWMANKFQSAMPGALLGTDHIIAFLPHHFYLLYVS